jgi:hypothetical protein
VLDDCLHRPDYQGLWLPRSHRTAGFFTRLRALADDLDGGFVPADPQRSR